MRIHWWELLAGVAVDLVLGDPRWFPHPIRGFGWVAVRLETLLRRAPMRLYLAGCLYWFVLVGSAGLLVSLTLPWANVFWVWILLALRDLDFEAGLVLRCLERGDLAGAREKLSFIVGRDTADLDEPEILRAVVETIAENLSDAVIAPLFYLILAGPACMAVYKAINTLDSMVGYKDARYREFGWASARMDDLANWIPARLTAGLVWIASALMGYGAWRSLRITLRDASSQPSPNAGYPEAAVAGALGVRLGGVNTYRGVVSRKEYLGDPVRPLDRKAFTGARRLLYATTALMVAIGCGVLR